jgi:hypothetical protein
VIFSPPTTYEVIFNGNFWTIGNWTLFGYKSYSISETVLINGTYTSVQHTYKSKVIEGSFTISNAIDTNTAESTLTDQSITSRFAYVYL